MTDNLFATILNNGQTHKLSKLTEFGFETADGFGVRRGTKLNSTLFIGDKQLPIEFRVRASTTESNVCSFVNISLASKALIRKHLRDIQVVADGNEDLVNCSYDELAKGITSSNQSSAAQSSVEATNSALRSASISRALKEGVEQTSEFDSSEKVEVLASSKSVSGFQPTSETVRGSETESESLRIDERSLSFSAPSFSTARESSVSMSSGVQTAPGRRTDIREFETVEEKLDTISAPPTAPARTEATPASNSIESIEIPDTPPQAAPAEPQKNSFAKTMALLMLLFVLAGLVIGTIGFLKSRSSLSVANSVMVGNYIPVNARVAGEVKQVLVTDGQHVKTGDVLMVLDNQVVSLKNEEYRTEMESAGAKVEAIQKQLKSFETKMSVATEKLSLDLEVAVSQLRSAQRSKEAAHAVVNRLKPVTASGAVSKLEFEEAEMILLAAESEVDAKQNLVRQIKFSQKAAGNNVLIMGDQFDDQLGRIEADLRIAQAEHKRAKKMVKLTTNQLTQLNVVAPRDGQVYSTYKQVGEYLRVADEAVALTYPGKTWATGSVTSSQASRVRPGQPVTVTVPALGLSMEGIVSAVGHRSVYSKGGYNAEFRGPTATDVPIKVALNELPDDVPAGLRLDMAISTGYGIKWLDNVFGYELKPLLDSKTRERIANAAAIKEQREKSSSAVQVAER